MKYLPILACLVLTACGGSSDPIEMDVIIVDGSDENCAQMTTVMAWDGEGQDYLITYCSCHNTYPHEGPQYCPE